MRRDNGIRRRIRRQEGVAAVEFAIIMPVALLIVVGIIQFGVIYSQYQVLQGAAREGARCASVQAGGLTTCDVTTTVENAALDFTLSETPVVAVEDGGSACTNETRGHNVTVSWDQQLDTGALFNMVPGMPDTITTTISGTFRCE